MSNINPTSSHDSTRRNFLQKFGVGTGATAGVVAAALKTPLVHAAGDETIKVGLVGCGGRGSGAAVNAMEADYNVRIVALGDLYDSAIASCRRQLERKYEKQLTVTDEHCYAGVDAYKKVLADDIDVVLLCSPPHFRPDHFEAAVEAGKQIFCEKPVATDPTGVRRVIEAGKRADEKGLNVVSGLCWRYHTGMVETVNRVLGGDIGKIVNTQANYLTSPVWMKTRKPDETEMEYQMRNWYNYIWLSGDHYVEQFIHSLDKAMWLRNDVPPVRAYGMGGRDLRNSETEGNIYDHFSVVYEWEDGSRTFAYTRQMPDCFSQVEDFVYGTEGSAELCAGKIIGPKAWTFEGDVVQMHQAEQNEFFKAVRGQRDRINNSNYMCSSTMMSILGREVCYTGRVLTYDEVFNSPMDLRPESYDPGEGPAVVVPYPNSYKFPVA